MTTQSALTERDKNTALATVPAYVKRGDKSGTEQIGTSDIRPPALKLAQSGTPATKRSDAAYIEGLREGDLFNSLTKENYGSDPLSVVVIMSLGHRNMVLRPLGEGGGIIEANIPDNDPRCEFPKGGGKPVATTFFDFLIRVCHKDGRRENMTVSLKGGQIGKAKDWNTLLKNNDFPAFATQWSLTPVAETKKNFNFFGWKIQPAGWASEEDYAAAERLCASLQGKEIHIDDSDGDQPQPEPEQVPF